ncbi:MAG: hypothetical protein EOO05_01410 [Chitinophagaceae bacterium]|nr:MAG: hypothetical protein EOO05_01410 [Chitinophagaceae bacterium]
MKKWYLFPALLLFVLAITGCKKEYSLENGFGEAEGSLRSEVSGDCLPKTVAGSFEATVELTDSNYIEVAVDVVTAGTYTISSDTLNGIYFSATGRFFTTGLNTIRLRGSGTPLAEGVDNFLITFGLSSCQVAVTTLPEGAGGPSEYTLTGAPGGCTGAVVDGLYTQGIPLDLSNRVEIAVDVTKIGTYTISTTAVNGMTFSGTGTFGTLGATSVILSGSGTPVSTGFTSIPVPGTQSCTFDITVVGPAAYTIECATSMALGTYTEGEALNPSNNQVQLDLNVSEPGAYNITATVNGMTFSLSGQFFAAGPQTIFLDGSGTPASEGDFQLPINGTSGSCDVTISVAPGASIDWSFTEGTTNNYSGQAAGATLDTDPGTGALILEYDGDNSVTGGTNHFFITLIDVTGGAILANETYSTSNLTPTVNFAAFQYTDPPVELVADFTMTPPPTLTYTILEHNTATKFIRGIFSGVSRDDSNVSHNISNGKFEGFYQ